MNEAIDIKASEVDGAVGKVAEKVKNLIEYVDLRMKTGRTEDVAREFRELGKLDLLAEIIPLLKIAGHRSALEDLIGPHKVVCIKRDDTPSNIFGEEVFGVGMVFGDEENDLFSQPDQQYASYSAIMAG